VRPWEFFYGFVGKKSGGVGLADGVGATVEEEGGASVTAATSVFSLCTSGNSPSSCLSQEQMITMRMHAEKATQFRSKDRIGAGTVMATLRPAQGQSGQSW
jgi:hypothetical protein